MLYKEESRDDGQGEKP